MKWSAFSKAIEDLRSDAIVPGFRELHRDIARVIEVGQRFYLPDGSNLIEGKLHADLFDLYRLPFDHITILHNAVMDGVACPVLTVAAEIKVAIPEPGPDQPWCSITSVVLHPIRRIWVVCPTALICKSELKPGEWGLQLSLLRDEPLTNAHVEMLGTARVCEDLIADLNAVTNLCALLGMKNIEAERVAAPTSINAKRLRKGKALLLDYHVLKVDGEAWTSEDDESSGGGSGSRSHLRRGHIRRLADGRRIWVRAAYVHGRVDGFVNKDYEVVA